MTEPVESPRSSKAGRAASEGAGEPIASRRGDEIVLPGIATAHSHAFQRALRGRAQRLSGSFWSWRGLMYELAERLGPDEIYAVSRFAFAELALAGVTAVGEFHYLQHGPNGTPYAQRTEMADAVIRAARDVGLRIALLRVLYHRGGYGRPAEGAQRRFSDAEVDHALSDVDTLRTTYADDPHVRIGIAPHSVRAVPRPWLAAAAAHAEAHALPLHAHVAEQRREIRECLAEHGLRPVELLADDGILSSRFVAVHATHLRPHEARELGAAKAFACICRTTERDLGDGLPDVPTLRDAGARFCTGVDSHAISDPFEEARAIELDARLREERRHVAAEAPALLAALTRDGYESLALEGLGDTVVLDARDPALVGATTETLDDAVVFGASPRAVKRVTVGGHAIVEDGALEGYDGIRHAFEAVLANL